VVYRVRGEGAHCLFLSCDLQVQAGRTLLPCFEPNGGVEQDGEDTSRSMIRGFADSDDSRSYTEKSKNAGDIVIMGGGNCCLESFTRFLTAFNFLRGFLTFSVSPKPAYFPLKICH